MVFGDRLLWSFLISGTLLVSILFTSMQANFAFADFNFGAAGDFGCSSSGAGKTISNMKSHTSAEKFLLLGDYSYQSTGTCFFNLVDSKGIKSRSNIAIGNHEDDSSEGFSAYMSFFGLSKTYYAFTYGNARVIVMDSDHSSYSSGSSQYNFVINELQSASQNSNIKWIIVYLHKQMYTSPNTCSSGSCSNTGSDATNLRNIYHAKFDQYGVDVVLNGHVHNFQRTYPIKYDPGSPSSPTKTSSASTEYADPTGEIFVTVGTGGINFHGLSGKASWVEDQQDDRFGSLDLSVENNGYTLAGRYYTNDGVIRDVFKITKTGTAQYTFGPSLSLSGKEAALTVPGDEGSLGLSGGDLQTKNSQDNGKQLGQVNGQGKGLDCEHFKQKVPGPERCR